MLRTFPDAFQPGRAAADAISDEETTALAEEEAASLLSAAGRERTRGGERTPSARDLSCGVAARIAFANEDDDDASGARRSCRTRVGDVDTGERTALVRICLG